MELFILIPALLVFLYMLFRLVKDDYVFIRKGISLEQMFDIAFVSLWVSLFFSRLFFLLYVYKPGKNIFFEFFSFKDWGFSLSGAIIGGIIAVVLLGKYKRMPLGRLSDFLSLSFLFSLPVAFLMSAFIIGRNELLYVFLNAALFFLMTIFFMQFLYPRLTSRTLKEGTLSILFLFFFSVISLFTALLHSLKDIHTYFNFQNATSFLLLIGSVIVYFKEEKPFARHRRIQR